MNRVTEFRSYLRENSVADALHYLATHPELVDPSTRDGHDFLEAAVLEDSATLVQAFFDKNKGWPEKPDNSDTVLVKAAEARSIDSMHVLLKNAPNPVKQKWAEALEATLEPECTEAGPNAAYQKAYNCALLLVQAGALNAPNVEGRTIMENQLFFPPSERIEENWRKDTCYLMRLGGDVKPWLDARNKNVRAGHEVRIPTAVKSIEAIVADAQKRVGKYMDEMTPDKLLERLSATPLYGLPRNKAVKSLRGDLYALLSAGRADMLLAPEYWHRHGGAGAGITLADRLQERIPDHLDYLRERLDTVPLLREGESPRVGSVTVEYVAGKVKGRQQ